MHFQIDIKFFSPLVLPLLLLFSGSRDIFPPSSLDILPTLSPPHDEFGLTAIAAGKSKFLGNVYSSPQLDGFADYWNQVTPENAGKWGSVERIRDNMNWSPLDAAYELAKQNGFPFKLHVLIWGNQQPSWMENLSIEEQLKEIKEWFQGLADRYEDIDFIEVVNEPLHDPPNSPGNGGGNYINALGGTGTTGWDWIIEAFRLARQYFPESKLMINEYNVVNSNQNTSQYLSIIQLLMEENLIDQIGVQAHAFSTRGSTSQMANNLDALGSTGLPVYVTELDIDGPTDEVQLADYQRIFPVFWEHEAIKGITLWGFRVGMWRTDQKAYLIENDGVTERPALTWLRDYVANTTVNVREIGNPDQIEIYPNPINSNKLTVEGVDDIQMIEVFNSGGQMMLSIQPQENIIVLDTMLNSGIYYFKIYDEKHEFTKKIVVKRL